MLLQLSWWFFKAELPVILQLWIWTIIDVPFFLITAYQLKNSSVTLKSSRGRRLSVRAGEFEDLIYCCLAVWPTGDLSHTGLHNPSLTFGLNQMQAGELF